MMERMETTVEGSDSQGSAADSQESGAEPTGILFSGIPFSTAAASVFMLSFAVLVFEVTLTRLFSVFLRYHFVFLVVSVSVCGLGLGGLILHQCRPMVERFPARLFLFINLIGFAVSIPVFVLLILRWLVPNYPGLIAGMAALMLIPFLFAGAFLAYAFERFGQRSGQLYAADLAGAGLAAGAVIWFLKAVGAIDACFVAATAVSVSGLGLLLLPAWPQVRRHSSWVACGLTVLLLNVGVFIANRVWKFADVPPIRTDDPEIAQQIPKPLFQELADSRIGANIVRTDWSAFARTDVVEENDAPDVKYIWTDGEVPTHMERFDGDLNKVAPLKRFIGYLPYATGKVNRALCIGPGGGLDILLGMLGGAGQIEGAEINPSIPDIMRDYSNFNGNLYEQSNVRVSVADGRSYVRHSPRQYNLIYLALTQTATSGNVGLALVESYIHTTDALQDYLEHLTPHGRVVFITQEYSLLCRYFTSAVQVRVDRGTPSRQACRYVAMFTVSPRFYTGNPYRNLILVQKTPISPEQALRLQEAAREMGLDPLYVPGLYEGKPFGRVASGELDVDQFVELFREHDNIDITPVSDDSPFFLDLTLSVPRLLTQLWIGALILVAAFSAWAILSVLRDPASRGRRLRSLSFVPYFAALGVGFMLVEIALAQKMILFLGYPTLALSVILCSLLLGGGCGSFMSQKLEQRQLRSGIVMASLGVVALVIFEVAVMQLLFRDWHISSITIRSLLSILLLFPLGFFLGIMFPSGIRLLDEECAEDIPWMWGVNGVTSVAGSVLAAVGAKLWGFNYVLALGGCIYLSLMVCFLRISILYRRASAPAAQVRGS
ncbi:MAG: hypothetical protein CO095_19265 [Armatimonadetes bacterium CG_4_9_14_3_um_filter_58_7]|nr:MAG: hypothetical protein CO095_19265 [Armatimonadetes bacterium CG_4_9_14_3_um_filter_58_7]